jgi:multisubunit Na+/H+ antiporter MnhC subunit
VNVAVCITIAAAFGLGFYGMWYFDRRIKQIVAAALKEEAEPLVAEHDFERWEASL